MRLRMAGRNNNPGSSGGRSSGRGCGGRGHSYHNSNSRSTETGLCKDLESNIFDFGTMTSVDLMQMTQEKIVQYAASTYHGNIANELKNWTQVVIDPTDYFDHIMARHRTRVSMVRAQQANLLRAMKQKKDALVTAAAGDPTDMNAAIDWLRWTMTSSNLNLRWAKKWKSI